MKFSKIRYKNVLSFGNHFTEVQLDRSPSTIIEGFNGGGKSTLLDSICFVLFGKPFRKITKSHLVNHKNKKDLVVEVEFTSGDVPYMIRRGINPALFEIWRDGEMVDQTAAVKDYQVYLEQSILKFDFSTFTQLVILGKATYVSFMRMDAAGRRKFSENMMNLVIFSTMNEIHKQKYNELKLELLELTSDAKILRERQVVRKKYLEDLEADYVVQKEGNVKKIDEQIDALNVRAWELENDWAELDAQRPQLSATTNQDKLEGLIDMRSKLNAKMSVIQPEIAFFKKHDTCPTCSQPIDEIMREEKIKAFDVKLTKLKGAVEQMSGELATVRALIDEENKLVQRSREITQQQQSIRTSITSINKQIDVLQESKHTSVPNRDKIEAEILILKDIDAAVESAMADRTEAVTKSEYFELMLSMLKDTGIKSMVIKKYVPIINATINNYLTRLGFFAKFVMDENFDERIYARGIDELSYANFSEGEKLRIDLAILLAWRDIAKAKSGMHCNLLILDEILDSSLDSVGCDAFMEIITHPSSNTNLFVVSHSPDKWADKFRSSLKFEKVDGFSQLK